MKIARSELEEGCIAILLYPLAHITVLCLIYVKCKKLAKLQKEC